jgi:hypothetical protein
LFDKKNKQGLLVMDEFLGIALIDNDGSNALEAEFRTIVQLDNIPELLAQIEGEISC